MWPSLLKIQYTELKLSCGNDHVVNNSIYSNGDLDLWPNEPKIKRYLPLPQGNYVTKFGKDPINRPKVIVRKPVCPPARHTQSHNTDRLETGVLKWGRDGSTGGCHWKSRICFFASVTFFSRKLQKRSLTCMTRGPLQTHYPQWSTYNNQTAPTIMFSISYPWKVVSANLNNLTSHVIPKDYYMNIRWYWIMLYNFAVLMKNHIDKSTASMV